MDDTSLDSVGVCLDIGSNNVVGMMAEVMPDGMIEVHALSTQESRGMNEGMFNNINTLINAVHKVIEDLETQFPCTVSGVSASISGVHILGRHNTGVVTINTEKFTEKDKAKAIHEAGKLKLEKGEGVIHVLPQYYIADDMPKKVENAVGLAGVRFELHAHLVTGATNELMNLTNCIESCGVTLDNIVYEGLASSIAVMSDEERENGVCVIDIGEGVSDVVVYKDGVVVFNYSFPIAGGAVTRDIAFERKVTSRVAEEIKILYGTCESGYIAQDEMIELPVIPNQSKNHSMPRKRLAYIIEARYREIFEFLRHILEKNGAYYPHDTGIILTGGASQMPGLLNLAEEVFERPVRLGTPRNIISDKFDVDNPRYSTVVGLLAAHKHENVWQKDLQKTVSKEGFFSKIVRIFREKF